MRFAASEERQNVLFSLGPTCEAVLVASCIVAAGFKLGV